MTDHAHLTPPPPFRLFRVPGARTVARGINYYSVIVGTVFDAEGPDAASHGFRWDPADGEAEKAATIFDVPDKIHGPGGKKLSVEVGKTVAAGINDKGDIVGNFTTADGFEYGFWRDSAGNFTVIDSSKDLAAEAGAQSVGTHATCINNDRYVGGRVFYPSPFSTAKVVHGFLQQIGGAFQINDAEPNLTEIYGINAHNTVVGVTSTDGTRFYAFVKSMGNPVPLPIGFGTFSRGRGITSGGKIVGQYTTLANAGPNSHGHGFLWDFVGGGPFQTIDVVTAPNQNPVVLWFGAPDLALSTHAHGINDNGIVVGECRLAGETSCGFMMTEMLWSLWRSLQTTSRWADAAWRVQPFPPRPATRT